MYTKMNQQMLFLVKQMCIKNIIWIIEQLLVMFEDHSTLWQFHFAQDWKLICTPIVKQLSVVANKVRASFSSRCKVIWILWPPENVVHPRAVRPEELPRCISNVRSINPDIEMAWLWKESVHLEMQNIILIVWAHRYSSKSYSQTHPRVPQWFSARQIPSHCCCKQF